MGRPALEVADIFRIHGPAWRKQHAGHLSLGQLKAMSAIEQCRTAALGGHALRCNACCMSPNWPPRREIRVVLLRFVNQALSY